MTNTDNTILGKRSTGYFVQFARDVTVRKLTIPAGEYGRIIDVDENGDLTIFVCRWFDELSHRRNIIALTAEQATLSVV